MGGPVIAAYILIETEAGKAASVAAALRELPGVSETASLAGPYDIIARAEAPDLDDLARLVRSGVQAIDGVSQTTSCPVVHLLCRPHGPRRHRSRSRRGGCPGGLLMRLVQPCVRHGQEDRDHGLIAARG